MERLKLAFSILRSKSYVVLTDAKAVISIPLMKVQDFNNILLLSAQTTALKGFQDRLAHLIKEHEQAIALSAKGVSKRKK